MTETKTIEQQASEANIDALVDETIGTESQPGQEAAPEQGAVNDATQSLEGLLSLVPLGFVAFGYTKVAAVWNEKVRANLAHAAIPVFRKYAWGQKIINFLETGSGVEEAALFMAAYPVVTGTMAAIAAEKAEMAAAQAKSEAVEVEGNDA